MRLTIEGGNLKIDVCWLLEAMSHEERLKLADTLACTDSVITYVAQQILDGWTEQGSHGSKACSASPEPGGGLDWAIREISMRSGFIAAKEILRLQDALKHEQEKVQKAEEENAQLRRHLLKFSTLD